MSRRGWALTLPVLVTVLVGAGLGGYVVLQDQREADRIEAVDEQAADYLSRVETFKVRVRKALAEADPEDPAALRRALRKAVADPPELAEVRGRAAERSSTYREAQEVDATLLEPYDELDAALKRSVADQRFVRAAREVLQLRVTDYVDGTLLTDSSQVRGSLIPAFVAARDEFAQVPVPKGAERAAELTRVAAQTVIDRATTLAESIDENRAYTFTAGEELQAAADAVSDYATQAEGDYAEALSRIMGT